MNVFEQFLMVVQRTFEFISSAFASAASYQALATFLEFIRKLIGNVG